MTFELPIYTLDKFESLNKYPPLESGQYRFKVIERKQGTSSKGFPQEQLILEVYHRDNHTMRCYHNFTFKPVDDDAHLFLIKLAKDFLECIGVEYTPDAFERVLNREGETFFEVSEYTSKNGDKREKFVIPRSGFLTETEKFNSEPVQNKTSSPSAEFNDDIPF